ncbi:hypothetical protein [Raineyella fluvialis]|uniref:Uncharacterized protein n=1 Tax=Raineyella fluvialis TaxID=2662261 RepID=A0A5Q2FEZ2_9ACTN|nr:hypothetical protein [Raineyella fluvialis]QGF23663.1 hypothetical protein Rai3103_08250 [Raineyella fluvialis]
MARYLCPQCAVHYRASEFTTYTAQSEPWSPPRRDALRTLGHGVRTLLGTTGTDRDRERAEHLEMLRLGVHHRCPQGHVMPAEFLRRETLPIGLVGPSSVSKSTYLAVLLQRIVGMTDLAPMGLTFTVEERSKAIYQRDYVTPLAMRRPPEQTRLERTAPLVVRMHRDWAAEDDVNLLFFDAAGEGYRDARSSAELNPYLSVMSGALVFCSPINLAFGPDGADAGFALPPGSKGPPRPARARLSRRSSRLARWRTSGATPSRPAWWSPSATNSPRWRPVRRTRARPSRSTGASTGTRTPICAGSPGGRTSCSPTTARRSSPRWSASPCSSATTRCRRPAAR